MAVTPTFSDNFSSLSLWNGTSGTWDTNYWYNSLTGNGGSLPSNGEQEWYINSNDPATSSITPWTVQNGILTITGSAAPSSIQPLINNYQYMSGELNTHQSFSQLYGFFEMRAELPAGQGLWPAFWMLPENGSWPPEIDIMEVLGSSPTTLYTSVHSGTASNEVNAGGAETVANTSTAYHEFAVDWTPTTITWYFDNQPVFSESTPSDMNVPMYLEVDLAMGGAWPGSISSSTPLPAEMRVANVEAYASNPNPITTSTVFTANNTAGQVLIGTPGNDTFYAGTNSVIMTGDGLTNTYIYNALPTAAGQITDFDPGTDTINLTTLLQSVGYTGSNPVNDGTITVVSDGNGGSNILYNHNGASTVIVDLDNVTPSAVLNTDFIYSGSSTSSSSGGGTSTGSGTSINDPAANNTPGQVLTATAPNATFQAGQNSVVMTEDGGSNTFVYTALPWATGQITNFNPASDKIDVSAMLKSVGYAGSNPFGDGTLTLTSDGHGGTDLVYNPPNAGVSGNWPIQVVDIDNVAPGSLTTSSDFVTGYGANASGSGTTTVLGPTLTANDSAGQVLSATAANATFDAGQSSVVMTEDGGANTFVYTALPWATGQITNFNPAADKIDVSAMLHAAGYAGTNPFGDGTLTLVPDGHSGTDLVYNPPNAGVSGNWPIQVVDIDNVAASALNTATNFVTGSGSSGSSSSGSGTTTPGPTLTANDSAGQVLSATAANATFDAEQSSVVMTEDGGANTFVYTALPWATGQITNFNPAADKIDVSAMLHAAGYAGTNPFGDGTLTLVSDGHNGTDLVYNPPNAGVSGNWPIQVVDIDNVAPGSLTTSSDFVTGNGTSASGSGTTIVSGPTLTASNTAGQVLHATAANATFDAGQSSVVMTEDGGANTFVYTALPWATGQITNFNPAADKIDVSAMLHAAGYAGTNPFGDGTLTLVSDGHSGTDLVYNPPNAGVSGNWPIQVVDIDNVAPGSLNTTTDFTTSAPSTGSGTAAGVTLTGNDTAGQALIASTPNDTFIAGQNSVVMTGDGGSNSFVFDSAPWNAGQITNFNPASDNINVADLLHSEGYAGANPFGDGTLSLSSDGSGGTNLYYNPPGAGANGVWPIKIVDIDHVAPTAINMSKDFILH